MVDPIQLSPMSGAIDTRPRDGLSPTSPHSDAGIRIEPPPSFACPTATMPAATAAADPPDEPPVEWSRFQGLRVGPYASGSVVIVDPHSGVFVRPIATNPASRSRRYIAESFGARRSIAFSARTPWWCGSPPIAQPRSFTTIGTPANGPVAVRLSDRAASKRRWMIALIDGSSRSAAAIADSTSSEALTSPARTRSAWAHASRRASCCGSSAGMAPR
ncbi:unannotated protein [freshwater metagenome]|uniref:Unannotated protein n=1 Tax=freshwater metagenome TaxID=449393 RepID=A0A6J6DPT2_9ZZZZ